MSYIDNILMPGESIRYRVATHWIVFLMPRFFLIGALIERYCSEYVLTNRRIITKKGFIRRSVGEINLIRVEGSNVQQSIFGRLLGYGTLTVHGTGTSAQSIDLIPNPAAFQTALGRAIVDMDAHAG